MTKIVWGVMLWSCSGLLMAADYAATIDWLKPAELGTTVSGVIAEVKVRKGQRVSKGEVLVRLDDRELKARLDSARAAYIESTALYEEALREEERSLELYDRTLLSDHELKVAQIDRTRAEAVKAQAAARQKLTEIELERTVLKSPFEGLIKDVHVVSTQMVVNRMSIQPLVTIVPLNQMRALATVDGKEVQQITVGMQAKVGTGDGWSEGTISDITMQQENSAIVEVVFTSPEKTMTPGREATIRLTR